MLWIIENMTKEPSYAELAKAVERSALHRLHRIEGDFKKADVLDYSWEPVIFTGSIQMCKLIHETLAGNHLAPLLYSHWFNYRCTAWYPRLGEFLFNDDYVMVPFSEVKRRKYWFYSTFAKEAMMFIRPDDGEKSFKGGLVDLQDFDRFYDQFETEKDNMVIVSSPKNIRGEWRFVVNDRQEIIAVSCYRFQGLKTLAPSAPKGATKLVEKVLKVIAPPDPVYCIDVAEDNDGVHWLLELTSFSAAGLYACDMDRIVQMVSERGEEEFRKLLS